MWFDLDKMKDAMAALDDTKRAPACDCERADGWHLWSCSALPQTLRDAEKRAQAARR